MTMYTLMQHNLSGDVYAVRYDLDEDERDAPGDTYNYDDQPEDVEWANALGHGVYDDQELRYIADLPAESVQ